jgi:hypothetical protein
MQDIPMENIFSFLENILLFWSEKEVKRKRDDFVLGNAFSGLRFFFSE